MKKPVAVYIDEFGNSHLDVEKPGAFSHFIYTSIIIEKDKIDEARQMHSSLCKKHNQGSPLKSSRLGRDEKGFSKRLRILEDLLSLDFIVTSLIINKQKIVGPGLEYSEVFYKYFSKIFINQFKDRFSSYSISIDKLGHQEFQLAFKKFIYNNCIQYDLFNPENSFELMDDKTEEPLLQLADFVGGCIGYAYCSSHSHERSIELINLLHQRTFVDFFPFENKNYFGLSNVSREDDQQIANIAVDSALSVLQDSTVSKEAHEVLKFLLLIFKVAPNQFVETYDIVDKLKRIYPTYSVETLRQNIQELRDKGAIISSIPGRSGYKIPDTVTDVVGFYNRYLNSIVPMLNRINIAEKTIRLGSVNTINLLTRENRLELLSEFLNVLKMR